MTHIVYAPHMLNVTRMRHQHVFMHCAHKYKSRASHTAQLRCSRLVPQLIHLHHASQEHYATWKLHVATMCYSAAATSSWSTPQQAFQQNLHLSPPANRRPNSNYRRPYVRHVTLQLTAVILQLLLLRLARPRQQSQWLLMLLLACRSSSMASSSRGSSRQQ
jgi:hypothetical protein